MKALKVSAVWIIGVLALAALAAPAWAGGWATITLDSWPEPPTAGESFKIGFSVRQHGQDDRMMSGLGPQIHFTHTASGEGLVVNAVDEGQPGHYLAEVSLPAAGEWKWAVQAFTMDQPMPALTVLEAGAAKPAGLPAPSLGLAAAGAGGVLLAIVLAGRRRLRLAGLAAAAALALGGFGLASAAVRSAPPDTVAAAAPSAAEMGEILFVAKGCVQCHTNADIAPHLRGFSTAIGPDLANYKASPEFLHLWLKDPRAVKPNTQMPNLQLGESEIDALIAFLSKK